MINVGITDKNKDVDNPLSSIPHKNALNKRKPTGKIKKANPLKVTTTNPLKIKLKTKISKTISTTLPDTFPEKSVPANHANPE
jgi:hypothetical protein